MGPVIAAIMEVNRVFAVFRIQWTLLCCLGSLAFELYVQSYHITVDVRTCILFWLCRVRYLFLRGCTKRTHRTANPIPFLRPLKLGIIVPLDCTGERDPSNVSQEFENTLKKLESNTVDSKHVEVICAPYRKKENSKAITNEDPQDTVSAYSNVAELISSSQSALTVHLMAFSDTMETALNGAASAVSTDIVVFLLPGIALPLGYDVSVRKAIKEPGVIAGAFDVGCSCSSVSDALLATRNCIFAWNLGLLCLSNVPFFTKNWCKHLFPLDSSTFFQ